MKHEREDGYDTVEWIANQPWCDGQVGTTGFCMHHPLL
ncbi:CocE/NonD family hydrolase [Thermodesulfobacteriota bacterium]